MKKEEIVKLLKFIAIVLDLATNLFILGTGVIFIIHNQPLSACICFGMGALWSIDVKTKNNNTNL